MLGNRVVVFSGLLISLALVSGARGSVLPLDGTAPDGRTYSDLTVSWWQWALATPLTVNPLTDPDGQNAHVGQNGPVWFLAPSLGPEFAFKRNITIPQNKYLFFPVLTSIAFNVPDESYTEAELRQQLADFNGRASILHAEIDGELVLNVWDYRVSSPPGGFQVELPVGNIYELPSGIYGPPAVTDGWWVLLEPLAPGSHDIIFTSATGDPSYADFLQRTTYNIQVVPEPAAMTVLAFTALLLRRRKIGRM